MQADRQTDRQTEGGVGVGGANRQPGTNSYRDVADACRAARADGNYAQSKLAGSLFAYQTFETLQHRRTTCPNGGKGGEGEREREGGGGGR